MIIFERNFIDDRQFSNLLKLLRASPSQMQQKPTTEKYVQNYAANQDKTSRKRSHIIEHNQVENLFYNNDKQFKRF